MDANMEAFLKAVEDRDVEAVRAFLYENADELEDGELKTALEKAEELAKEVKDYELLKLVCYLYETYLEIEKIPEFEALAFEEDTFEAKFQLADLYAQVGEVEKALALYRTLLEEETAKGEKEHIAEIYYNMALAHEELTEYEKALELMEKAALAFEELGKEDDYLHALIYLAYLRFENGDVRKAKAELAGLLRRIRDNRLLMAQAHLAFEEIFEDEDNYEAALQECLYALLDSEGTAYFDVSFDALVDVLWQLFLEDEFETVYDNMDAFAKAFPELEAFFNGVKAMALYKDGELEEGRVREIIAQIKDKRLLDLVQLLGESEL
ncbi:tetratricopeptide repeat protein [Palaeococcus ferrophilus]|uniref:tetratricopeptide repeat protein n=1 Tax=Palaeococcus ferrophilus TaxID=83868 RepID=UPI000A901724|nr:tetratricopeptide repeat protein [Palaeococcus ferrophilus]